MPHPCIGSSCSALSSSMSSVPCRRSPRSLATTVPFDRRRKRISGSFRLSKGENAAAELTSRAVMSTMLTLMPPLGEFELLVLVAVLRLEQDAYAVSIREEIETRTGRAAPRGSVYITLDRLARKGYLREV